MINQDKLRESKNGDVFALQGANGETGVLQDLEYLTHAFLSGAPEGRICLDFTSVGARRALPSSWDTALFDSRSWNGPQGLGVLAIKNGSSWRNPLPHLDVARAPRSFSLPLLIASAVALESWNREEEKIRHLSQRLRDGIRSTISDCDVAGELSQSLPHINSFSFLYVEGEELLRSLERRGFLVDSGSACTSEDLQPSHVLAAMGLLTHGNIRVTIKEETKEKDIDELLIAVRSSVEELRV
jgi:cysteine desulfurase